MFKREILPLQHKLTWFLYTLLWRITLFLVFFIENVRYPDHNGNKKFRKFLLFFKKLTEMTPTKCRINKEHKEHNKNCLKVCLPWLGNEENSDFQKVYLIPWEYIIFIKKRTGKHKKETQKQVMVTCLQKHTALYSL